MVWIGYVRSDKFRRDIVTRTFALIAQIGPFAPSLVQEQYSPKCTQTLQNATKHEFKIPWCVSGEFLAKSSDATSWHEL